MPAVVQLLLKSCARIPNGDSLAELMHGALKGTNITYQGDQPSPNASLILTDSPFLLENTLSAFNFREVADLAQKTTDLHRQPQKIAETCRKPQMGVCFLRLDPSSAAPEVA